MTTHTYEAAAMASPEFQIDEMRTMLARLKRWTQQNNEPSEDDFESGYDAARAYVRDVLALYQVGAEAEFQTNRFHPDWSLLEATQEGLREAWARIAELESELETIARIGADDVHGSE